MHPIWLAQLDKVRPVVILTREEVHLVRILVTVAPITTTVRGLQSEVKVGRANGLDQDSVVDLDLITTVPRERLLRPLGVILDGQEPDLARAIRAAFDLDD